MLKDILAQRLRALMHARPDLDTQVKIARGAGVSQSTVGRVLAAEVHTNLDVLESLARAYRIHPLALLSDPTQMTQPDAMAAGYQERQLLAAWRLLSPAQQHAVMGYIEVASLGAGALLGGSAARPQNRRRLMQWGRCRTARRRPFGERPGVSRLNQPSNDSAMTTNNPGSGPGRNAHEPAVIPLPPVHQQRLQAIRRWHQIESVRTDIEPAALVHVLLTADGTMHARSVGMEPEFRALFAAQLRDLANQLCPSTQQRAA